MEDSFKTSHRMLKYIQTICANRISDKYKTVDFEYNLQLSEVESYNPNYVATVL